MSSGGGQYSTTSGLPSPTSAESGLPAIAENMSSIVPQGNASPLSASPSISSMRRSSPNGPLFLGTAQSRPFIENHFAQSRPSIENHFGSIAPSGLGPHLLRFSPQNRENLTSHDHETEPGDNSRLPEAPISPLDARRNARISTLPRDNMSDSSKSSIISTLSSSSTAASSCGLPMTVDGDKKAVVSLPPLATFGLNLSSGPAYEEKSGRPTLQPLASRGAPSKPNHSSQSPFNSAASTGMKFESLQLPLPYNISFGQHPVPRPDHEGELANISDLQDISLERHPHRNLTHEQERKGAASTTPRAPPEPWHPPHQPTLPSLPPITRDASQKSIFQNANPLSVLAYAGRLVERECDSRLRRP